jgi:RNA polymerase sigma-70 factor (ECF subfamily)
LRVAELLSELLPRCRRGDHDAVAVLVNRFQPWAIDFATALLHGDTHLAEDVVQAAFVVALARLGDIRDPRAFPGWLRQIIRTECQRIARGRREAAEITRDRPSRATSPVETVEARERARIVREAIAALSRRSRETAELYYLEQLDGATIAERLMIPPGTVKRRLHDAREALRGLLLGYVHPPATPKLKRQDRPPL